MAATDDQWLQSLFLFHIVFAVFSGGIAVVFPSFWHVFFTLDEKGNQRELLNTAIQLYGSLIVGQAVLVYTLRRHLSSLGSSKSSPLAVNLRQGVTLAYAVVFALSFAFVVKAHAMGVMNVAAHANSALFIALAASYGTLFIRGTSARPKHTAL